MPPVSEELDLWGERATPPVVGDRIRVCRLAMGWKTVRLASHLNVSRAAVNYWESGNRQPAANMSELCAALQVSVAGLSQQPPAPPTSGPFFRSMLKKESVQLQEHASAYVRLVSDVATYLERRVGLGTPKEQPWASVGVGSDPSVAAREIRLRLPRPVGPIASMVRAAEKMGALTVFGIPPTRVGIQKVKSVDAYSAVVDDWPIIVMTSRGDYYRQRWDIAHELGHIVLHRGESEINEIMERQANEFAAELLLPKAEVEIILPHGEYTSKAIETSLSAPKEYWGVSFRALVRRANELGQISDSAYRRANGVLDYRWRQYEPGRMKMLEMPESLPEAFSRLVNYGFDEETIWREVGVPRTLLSAMVSRQPLDFTPSVRD